MRGTLLESPVSRLIIFLGLCWGPLLLTKYHVEAPTIKTTSAYTPCYVYLRRTVYSNITKLHDGLPHCTAFPANNDGLAGCIVHLQAKSYGLDAVSPASPNPIPFTSLYAPARPHTIPIQHFSFSGASGTTYSTASSMNQ